MDAKKHWIIVGASRGIGLEFVEQLLEAGHYVVAAVRNLSTAPKLFDLIASQSADSRCVVEQCDISSDESITNFIHNMQGRVENGMQLGNVVLNAGVLKYPNRATEISFADFALHLHTNTIGPIVCAQKLLNLNPDAPPPKVVFISSDSGSTTRFLDFEDGFGAYAASKSALNQMLRHMAAELGRSKQKKHDTVILALHPGEVETDMAEIELGWEVKGSINPPESVSAMLKVIAEKGNEDTGTFWCWDGKIYHGLVTAHVETRPRRQGEILALTGLLGHPVLLHGPHRDVVARVVGWLQHPGDVTLQLATVQHTRKEGGTQLRWRPPDTVEPSWERPFTNFSVASTQPGTAPGAHEFAEGPITNGVAKAVRIWFCAHLTVNVGQTRE
ncbi:hypothetical protein PG984_016519 [Apiospora sp. TS-2023a]